MFLVYNSSSVENISQMQNYFYIKRSNEVRDRAVQLLNEFNEEKKLQLMSNWREDDYIRLNYEFIENIPTFLHQIKPKEDESDYDSEEYSELEGNNSFYKMVALETQEL
jgi:hypothetical protein